MLQNSLGLFYLGHTYSPQTDFLFVSAVRAPDSRAVYTLSQQQNYAPWYHWVGI